MRYAASEPETLFTSLIYRFLNKESNIDFLSYFCYNI